MGKRPAYNANQKMTVKQEQFCIEVAINNKNQTEAYKAVYNAEKLSDKRCWEAASVVAANSKVKERIAELRAKKEEKLMGTALWSIEKASKTLLSNIALSQKFLMSNAEAGNINSSLMTQITSATRELNSIYGLNKQKLDVFNHDMQQFQTSSIDKLENNINRFWAKSQKINPLYTKNKYVLLEGGRASGKSYAGADIVLYTALTRPNDGVIICGREIQNSIKDSSKALLEMRIGENGLSELFDVLEHEIRVKSSKVKIIFLGLKEATRQDTIKGIANAFFIWVDEAQVISQSTIDKLIPTVIRNENYKLIFTMNRQFDADPVYIEMTKVRPHDALHVTLNYHDNPFCPKAIYEEAALMKEVDYHKYVHIWEGQPMTSFANSLWSDELIQSMTTQLAFNRDNYSRVEIGFDPATTNDEFSNEYGIIVGGLTKSGEAHVIADVSGHYSVPDVCDKIIETYYLYKADCITVETNQGGDWIRSMILTKDNRVSINEVRAISAQDKITRAKPIANLGSQGRIKHINGGFKVLESQMKRITEEGFKGSAGESPDRVDAYCWLAISLFNLTNMDTSDVYINITDIAQVEPYEKHQKIYSNSLYVHRCDNTSAAIAFDVIDNGKDKKIVVTDYDVFDSVDLSTRINDYLMQYKYSEINIPLDAITTPIINEYEKLYPNVYGIDDKFYLKKIDDKMMTVLSLIKQKKVCVDKLQEKTYSNQYGNLFVKELTGYKPALEKVQPILHCLADILFRECELSSE